MHVAGAIDWELISTAFSASVQFSLEKLFRKKIISLKKYIFLTFKQLKPGLPSSVTLQPAQGETEKPCGVDFILRCYVAKNAEDKIEKRNSVRLAIKKITHAPAEHTQRVSPSHEDH